MTIFATCLSCGGRIGWIDCPTGGWWHHELHPEDGHDAEHREPGNEIGFFNKFGG